MQVPWRYVGISVVRLHVDGVRARTTIYTPPAETNVGNLFKWDGGESTETVQLAAGAYAVVKCLGEQTFRMLQTDPARFGEAGGHPQLAAEQPVVFAGEVELNGAMQVQAWTTVSGMYQLPDTYAAQSGSLPTQF